MGLAAASRGVGHIASIGGDDGVGKILGGCIQPVCGEFVILAESAIRHTQVMQNSESGALPIFRHMPTRQQKISPLERDRQSVVPSQYAICVEFGSADLGSRMIASSPSDGPLIAPGRIRSGAGLKSINDERKTRLGDGETALCEPNSQNTPVEDRYEYIQNPANCSGCSTRRQTQADGLSRRGNRNPYPEFRGGTSRRPVSFPGPLYARTNG